MKFVILVVVCIFTIQKHVYGQDPAAEEDNNIEPSKAEAAEINQNNLSVEEQDARTPSTKEEVPSNEEPVPEVKNGFPPYNYTPPEATTTTRVDYDLDATSEPDRTTKAPVPANSTDHGLTNTNHSRLLKKLRRGGGLTFKEMSERYNRDAVMDNIYRVTKILAPFSWLTILVSVLTALFKIHEIYLR